jgi:uncharacterized protein YfaS (alpha-2-macroglobulin family)
VEEFLPDQMKIETQLSKAAAPAELIEAVQALVTLRNLRHPGERRHVNRMQLAPCGFHFAQFRITSSTTRSVKDGRRPSHKRSARRRPLA